MQYKLEIVFNSEREFSDYLEKQGIKVKATDPTNQKIVDGARKAIENEGKHKEHYKKEIKAVSHKNKSIMVDENTWLHGINTNKYKRGDEFNG